jgi:hypothetical protein
VSLDDGLVVRHLADDDSTDFAGLDAGDHRLALDSVADHCIVAGNNPRTVGVTAGDTVTSPFGVTCHDTVVAPSPVVVRAVVRTGGQDRDFDGYVLKVADSLSAVGRDDSVLVAGVAPGQDSVALENMAGNCSVTNGTARRQVPNDAQDTTRIDFEVSCDRMIAFGFDAPHSERDIYLIAASGHFVEPILQTPTVERSPARSRNGRRIAYSMGGNLYMMDNDGSHVVQITSDTLSDDAPSFSPDGSRLVFERYFRSDTAHLFIVGVDGTGLTPLVVDEWHESNPSWSPDGQRIAFESDRAGGQHLFAIHPDGSGLTQLTTDTLYDNNPAWSPDGSLIAFDAHAPTSNDTQIFVIHADGASRTQITPWRYSYWAMNPTWSPDGQWMAYRAGGSLNEIDVMRADGSNVQQLESSGYGIWQPAWDN